MNKFLKMSQTTLDIKEPGLNVLPPGVERHVVNAGGLTGLQIFPDDEIEIINDEGNQICEIICFDKDGKSVTLEQSKIDAARTTLNAEAAAVKYKTDRTTDGSTVYASFGDQLDMLYKDIVAGKLDTTGTWATHIKAVKDANPKPS